MKDESIDDLAAFMEGPVNDAHDADVDDRASASRKEAKKGAPSSKRRRLTLAIAAGGVVAVSVGALIAGRHPKPPSADPAVDRIIARAQSHAEQTPAPGGQAPDAGAPVAATVPNAAADAAAVVRPEQRAAGPAPAAPAPPSPQVVAPAMAAVVPPTAGTAPATAPPAVEEGAAEAKRLAMRVEALQGDLDRMRSKLAAERRIVRGHTYSVVALLTDGVVVRDETGSEHVYSVGSKFR